MTKTWTDYGIDLPNRGGAERYAICPQCSPNRKKKKEPCLSINVEKEVWYCHHCAWAGCLQRGVDRQYQANLHWKKPEWVKPEYQPDQGLSDQAKSYFEKRGIPEAVLVRNKITTGKVYMPQCEERVSAVQFPFFRNGECVNIKFRDHKKNFRLAGQAERILYGLDDINPSMLVIVEGEIDKLSIEAAGILSCVSVPDGAPPPTSKDYNNKFQFLENCKDYLENVQAFVLAVDNDEPGKRLQEELMHRLGRDRCMLVKWPEGCKDANEVLVKHGKDILLATIYDAEHPPIPGVVSVSELEGRLEILYDNGLEPGLSVGWKGMEELYNVSPGQWTLLTGIPGHGKSEVLDAILVNMAHLHDWSFALYSPENYPLEQHVAKLVEKTIGKPFAHKFGVPYQMDKAEMKTGATWLDSHFHFLSPKDDYLNLEEILGLTKQLIFRHGIRGLVIDPWNEIEHNRPERMTDTEYISYALTQIRQFARKNRIHIWLVAHPTKLMKDKNNEYPVPTPYDVSGSAHWHNKADNCLSVWRDKLKPELPTEVHIQKIRFKKNGKIGKCLLRYATDTGRYQDVLTA